MPPASAWVWLDRAVLIAAHDEQLAEHGGVAGFRDEGLFDSALARPPNLAAYESPDACALAASYAVALAKNHPFIDGNKRTAFVAMELFLLLNGHELNASDADCVLAMLAVASSEGDEATLAAWLREHVAPRA
ncbi:MAG: type II toxin-antitoxin system death-on-curing family toxin [Thiobacillus sp.]|nr:type II toxin-antitoxin system death-on-curing family toxin [Thiobacillus sp.]